MTGDTSVVSTSDSTNQPLSDDLIAESLLSLAKDARYIQQCQGLLLQVIEPMMGRYDSQSRSDLQKITLFLSYVLYTLLVVAPTGRTLGMEVCGLRFAETTKRRHLVGSLLTVTVGAFALDRLTTRNNTNDTTANREALRGGDRRRMYDILRRQMLQRAASQSTSISPPSTVTAQHSNNSERRQTEPVRSYRERALSVVRQISKSITDAMSHYSEGPHSLYTGQGVASTFSVATWILRLHLAQYCVTGKYPTILHRFLGLEHNRQERRIAFRPNTTRVVALLIGIQASSTLIRCLANWLAKKTAAYLESTSTASSLRRSTTHLFPTASENNDNRKGTLSIIAAQQSGTTCAICRMDRIHPAAPSSCGHVCCWNCLIQWVSTVRAECPLCRAPCRPQDVLALHNYELPSTQEKLT